MVEITFSDLIKQLGTMTQECATSYTNVMPRSSSVARAKMVVNNFNLGLEEIEDELEDIIKEMMNALGGMHEEIGAALAKKRNVKLQLASDILTQTLDEISGIMLAIEMGTLGLVRELPPPKNVFGAKYKVFLDNDEINTFEHVVEILNKEFGLSENDAAIAAQQVHVFGSFCVSEHTTVFDAEAQDERLQNYGLTSHAEHRPICHIDVASSNMHFSNINAVFRISGFFSHLFTRCNAPKYANFIFGKSPATARVLAPLWAGVRSVII